MSLPTIHDRQEQRLLTAGERQFSTIYGVSLLLLAGLVVGVFWGLLLPLLHLNEGLQG